MKFWRSIEIIFFTLHVQRNDHVNNPNIISKAYEDIYEKKTQLSFLSYFIFVFPPSLWRWQLAGVKSW
jgi:hypothetical protein